MFARSNIASTAWPDRRYRSTVSVPILRDDSAIGAISVSGTEPPVFRTAIAMLHTFADQPLSLLKMAFVLGTAGSDARSGAISRAMQALSEVSQAVNSTLDLEKVLATIVHARSSFRQQTVVPSTHSIKKMVVHAAGTYRLPERC